MMLLTLTRALVTYQTPRLVGFEEWVLPLLVFLLSQEGSLLYLEESVPGDLFLYLDQEVIASLLA
jgi:hypothetical protein